MISRDNFWWLPFGRVPEISALDLHAKLASDRAPQILDVRTQKEWKDSHIEGAISAPITSLQARLEDLNLDPQRPVVAVCLSAHRSIPAVRTLFKAEFDDVCQLQGGMLAWWKSELPVVKPR